MTKCISFGAHERASKAISRSWLVDSGATSHMTNDNSFLTTLKNFNVKVYLANGSHVSATGIGGGYLQCSLPAGQEQIIQLSDVLYVPELEGGLLSVRRIIQHGFKVVFEKNVCTIRQGSSLIAEARGEDELFKLNCSLVRESARVAGTKTCLHQWHRRLGH